MTGRPPAASTTPPDSAKVQTMIPAAVLSALLASGLPDAGTKEPEQPPVQRGPEVSEGRSGPPSPPLRDIPPARRRPGKRVHRVLPIPRPRPAPDPKDAGT